MDRISDKWIASVMGGAIHTDRHVVNGVLTYDYLAILKAITKTDGNVPAHVEVAAWKNIDFPIAFIVYGETQTIPWEDDGGDD